MTAALRTPTGPTSEVGRLHRVLLHRPGDELLRLTPRNNDRLLFDAIPWVGRAQEEHDAFADGLRARGVAVDYLMDLLVEVLHDDDARAEAVRRAVAGLGFGDAIEAYLADLLGDQGPEELARTLTVGLRNDEVGPTRPGGLVAGMLPAEEFLLAPLPNLMFTRDSAVVIGDRVLVTSLATPARARETALTGLIHERHPALSARAVLRVRPGEHVEGGDVLLLAPGVVAVGVGERTSPAGAERLARALFQADLAHTVLAVPITQRRATMHLDTVCTMVDVDTLVMYPPLAQSLEAVPVRRGDDGSLVVGPRAAFLPLAAEAIGQPRLHVIDTGLDPVTAEREQWDDGNNTLAIGPRLAFAYERNVQTNRRLVAAGIEVVTIAGSEMGSGRGGPRCLSCPLERAPLADPAETAG